MLVDLTERGRPVNRQRLESIARRSGVDYHELIGLTRAGRLLFAGITDERIPMD